MNGNELFFNQYRDNRGAADLAPHFDNQEKLWQFFEGQEKNILVTAGVNVLTMRLLLAQDALSKLKDYENNIRSKPGNYIAQVALLSASGVILTTLQPDGFIGEQITPPTIRVHEYYYGFLTSVVSVLDRLAYEIDEFYQLEITKVDWRNLNKGYAKLELKNPKLKQYLEKNELKNNRPLAMLFEHRDVVEHRGSVKIVEFSDNNVVINDSYAIRVQSRPRDIASPHDTELTKFANDSFHLVVSICDGVYGLML